MSSTASSAVAKATAPIKRIREIDFIKALCILAMITTHCYEEFYCGDDSFSSTLLVDVFNVVIGASAFMFCMGFTMDLKREKSSADCLKRGALLLLAGLLLNVLRSPLMMCFNFMIEDPNIVFIGMIDVLSVDILPFAGWAFILMGILKACKLKPWGIFIVALILSAVGTLLQFTDTGIPLVNSILAFFIGSNAESYFPLFHWFIFVAAGNLCRVYYLKAGDSKNFYKIAFPVSVVISAIFIFLAMSQIGPFQCLSGDLCYYTWMNPADALGSIACIITYMSVMWLLSLVVEKIQPKYHPLTYLGENLTILYFIHWILLMFVEYALIGVFEVLPEPEGDLLVFVYAIVFLVITIFLCELYKKYLRNGLLQSVKKYPGVWATVVVVLVVLCVSLSVANGLNDLSEVPSFLNDYTVDGIEYC